MFCYSAGVTGDWRPGQHWEVLQAFKCERVVEQVSAYLEPFPMIELSRADYMAAAALYRTCAANGVTASTTDCQIATAAIQHDGALLTTDKDFTHIARVSNLEVMELTD